MKKKKFMLLMLFLLGIGFAGVSTSLLMTGNTSISTNNDNYDVIFTEAILNHTDISSTAIQNDGKSITFTIDDLLKSRENLDILSFVVTNNSTMYDAFVSLNCTTGYYENNYYETTKQMDDFIEAKTVGVGQIEISLLKYPVDDITDTITCTLKTTASEKTQESGVVNHIPTSFNVGGSSESAVEDYNTLTYPAGATAEGQPAKVFTGYKEGQNGSVCIVKNGSLQCFKGNNFAEEVVHLKSVFGDINCHSTASRIVNLLCSDDEFRCLVSTDQTVICSDLNAGFECSYRGTSDSSRCYYGYEDYYN